MYLYLLMIFEPKSSHESYFNEEPVDRIQLIHFSENPLYHDVIFLNFIILAHIHSKASLNVVKLVTCAILG